MEILFENGKSKLQSHCGVVLGAIMVSVLIAYAVFKAQIMFLYRENTIQEPIEPAYFGPDFVYDSRDGWRVAFGLTAYDSSSDPTPFDDSFGKLLAYTKIWGEKDEEGNIKPTYFKQLETRQCTKEDINFDGDEKDNAKFEFWKPAADTEADTKRFFDVLQCITDEPTLMGDFNSAAAHQLTIVFEMCRGEGCKDEEVIKDWMQRKFILTLENTAEFNKETIEDDKVTRTSTLTWNVLSPQMRTETFNYV